MCVDYSWMTSGIYRALRRPPAAHACYLTEDGAAATAALSLVSIFFSLPTATVSGWMASGRFTT